MDAEWRDPEGRQQALLLWLITTVPTPCQATDMTVAACELCPPHCQALQLYVQHIKQVQT